MKNNNLCENSLIKKRRWAAMEGKINKILTELQKTNDRFGNMEKGQEEITSGQVELTMGQKELASRMDNLEKGQNEIKEMIKHSTTLMTENFTYIRKDMRTFERDVNADIELLFKEGAEVKRKVNKLEQSKK
jgi:uncharacterized phage infection (PIP) family protein YhgE